MPARHPPQALPEAKPFARPLPKLDRIGDMIASCAGGRHEAARRWRPIAPASYAIHRSAWKVNSAKFAGTEFSEVHIQHRRQLVLGSHPRLATSAADGPLHSRRPQKERTDLSEHSSALDRPAW